MLRRGVRHQPRTRTGCSTSPTPWAPSRPSPPTPIRLARETPTRPPRPRSTTACPSAPSSPSPAAPATSRNPDSTHRVATLAHSGLTALDEPTVRTVARQAVRDVRTAPSPPAADPPAYPAAAECSPAALSCAAGEHSTACAAGTWSRCLLRVSLCGVGFADGVHVIACSELVVPAAGWPSRAGPRGFRCSGWAGGLRPEVPKVATDSCGSESVGRDRLSRRSVRRWGPSCAYRTCRPRSYSVPSVSGVPRSSRVRTTTGSWPSCSAGSMG